MGIQVQSVEAGTPAAKLGIQPGDVLLTVGRNPLNDMLDYEFYTSSPRFEMTLCRDGQTRTLQVRKDQYEPFGCDFKTYLIDKQHSCANHCMFCFIDQLPQGMRPALYFKDDDERLSFLFGNYITLTNLSPHEVERIGHMHISPINISVHTTNPELRVRMMANKRAGETLAYLKQFAAAGIEMNCQLVLCRGINDGDELRRTLDDLCQLHESILSIAAVPSGVTRYRKGLYPLTPYDQETAAQTLDILEEYGRRCVKEYGTRLIYPGDEWYLAAGRPVPEGDFYEEYAQLENGVGMWRLYRDEFLGALAHSRTGRRSRRMDVVTGTLAAPLIQEMMEALHGRHPSVKVTVHPIQNNFFGGNISVAGLVTGTDIIDQCKGKLTSDVLGVPEVMLRDEQDRFLDDVTVEQLAEALGVRVKILPVAGADNLRAILEG